MYTLTVPLTYVRSIQYGWMDTRENLKKHTQYLFKRVAVYKNELGNSLQGKSVMNLELNECMEESVNVWEQFWRNIAGIGLPLFVPVHRGISMSEYFETLDTNKQTDYHLCLDVTDMQLNVGRTSADFLLAPRT